MAADRALPLAAALLVITWAVTFLVDPWSDVSFNDLGVYRGYADAFLDGAVPYRDVFFEYPPLAALVMALPGLAGTGHDTYELAFAILALAAAGVILGGCARLAARTDGSARLALLGAALFPLLSGAMLRTHYDVVAVALTVTALVALCAERPNIGFALIGLGAMTKVFPLIVAPVALAWLVGRGERRAALHAAATLVATMAVVGLPALALAPDGVLDFVRFHFERPVLSESSPASVLWILEALGAGPVSDVPGFRSHGIGHRFDAVVVAAFVGLGLAVLVALTRLAARSRDPRGLVLASLGGVLAFATFGKVLSPQFLVWAAPLFALALAWRLWALAAALGAATALTLAFFPSRYLDLVAHEPLPIVLLAARNAALLLAMGLTLRELGRKAGARAGPATARASPVPSSSHGAADSS